MLELGGQGQEEFFLVGLADKLDVDGETFGRSAHGKRDAGKPS